MNPNQVISLPMIKRLPLYFRVLEKVEEQGALTVSSAVIAEELGLEPVQVRKDLAALGVVGQPRIGFEVSKLMGAIRALLGWDNSRDVFIIGAGNLGAALAGYNVFKSHGMNIVAAFDTDPEKIGQEIHGKMIFDMERLWELVHRMHVHIGILTVPVDAAQRTAELMVNAGIRAIWNFTPVKLTVPENIVVERVDLLASLAVLTRGLRKLLDVPGTGEAKIE
ncbi:MAG: redox-sensing transcriptional repressor Rex [Phycisphaerae bacterium]|nr:redox-sensing transcriptional repressor Rex [Phycisphaerae bacterium]